MESPKKPNLDSITTINQDGSRYFLHPADVRGRWLRLRRLTGWFLLAVTIVLPWIRINGNPAVFLDIEHRMFHLFGLTLIPQDLWVMFFAISGIGFTLFFLTSLLGRVWCGWACPYTVLLDHLYRRIERWIDGDALSRRALNNAPWNAEKMARWSTKHLAYAIVSALIALVFLSYFMSLDRLHEQMQEEPLQHASTFGLLIALTGILWFCFGYFREQFCIIMCPYGRLQSALTDEDTINVGYDERRGEPRGKWHKELTPEISATAGDCIDCQRCVKVCPTGIDIRNGLQLECIGCTACIDACDEVMTRVGRATGLIRYDSLNGFAGKGRRFLRPRTYAYSAFAAMGLAALLIVAWAKARPVTATISRVGEAGFYCDAHSVRNIYMIRLINKRNQAVSFTIQLGDRTPSGYDLSGSDQTFEVAPLGEISRTCVVITPLASYHGATNIDLILHAQPGDLTLEESVRFLGPNPQSIQLLTPQSK